MQSQSYYVPAQSPWPIVGAIAMFFIAVGAGLTVMQLETADLSGVVILSLGVLILLYMLFGCSFLRSVVLYFMHVYSLSLG